MKLIYIVIAALLLSAQSVVAEDYPFFGFFTGVEDALSPRPMATARCALTFYKLKPNGSFVSYHVDMEQFIRTKTVRYVAYVAGTCTYDKTHKMEACYVSLDTSKESQGKTFYSIIESIGPSYIKTTDFGTMEEALAYIASGEKGKAYTTNHFRCPFDEARMATMITTTVSDLNMYELGQLTLPGPEHINSPETAELVKALGLKVAE